MTRHERTSSTSDARATSFGFYPSLAALITLALACGATPQATQGASAANAGSSEPVPEAAAVEPEAQAVVQEAPQFEVVSHREFLDDTLPAPTDDSAWPPAELAVPLPEGVQPVSVTTRIRRHILTMETELSPDAIRAHYVTAFEAAGLTLVDLDAFPNELLHFTAQREGNATRFDVVVASAGNDKQRLTYTGPRMPPATPGGETASEEACRTSIGAAAEINRARVFPNGMDQISETMRAAIEADFEAEVELCAGHWRVAHLECYEQYENEPSMLEQCTQVARRDSGQEPLPI